MNKTRAKLMGIYSSEILECGCEIRKYLGGIQIQSGCDIHRNRKLFVCPICDKILKNKKILKEHKWTHANE